MAQHTPVQLQFSDAAVSHQATTVSDQHAPAIIQNPPVNPNPNSVHPMVTCFRVRTNRPTKRLNIHVSSISPLPKSYRDAFNDPNWQNAILDEYTALTENKTWTLVPRPPNTDIVRCMWLFHHKYLADGMLSRYKACLVENGSTQLERVDVDEKFSLVLNQPPGFRDSAHPDYVCLLQRQGIDIAYLLLYVDDIVLTASSEGLLQRIIGSLHQEFAMTDLGPLNYFLVGLLLIMSSKLGVDGDSVSDSTLYRSLADLVAYYDVDWAGCPTTRRSTSGYCVFFGNNLLSWSAKRQPTLSRSSAEAEYRGVINDVAETCWLRNLLRLRASCTFALSVCGYFTKGLPSALFEEFRSSLSVRSPPASTAGLSLAKNVSKEKGEGSASGRKFVVDEVEDVKVEKGKKGNGGGSVLDELIKEEEKAKERSNRKDYWLCEGIVVKVMSKDLADKGYYKQKGVVRKVIDKYVGEIKMIESKHKLRVDQEELETVIPQIGGVVRVVNGAYCGSNARLLSVNTDKFCAKVQIEKGVYLSKKPLLRWVIFC
nr:hypothetical protein [Tanacetum cinerariifolium]